MDRTFLGRSVYQVSLDQSVGLLADRLLDLDLRSVYWIPYQEWLLIHTSAELCLATSSFHLNYARFQCFLNLFEKRPLILMASRGIKSTMVPIYFACGTSTCIAWPLSKISQSIDIHQQVLTMRWYQTIKSMWSPSDQTVFEMSLCFVRRWTWRPVSKNSLRLMSEAHYLLGMQIDSQVDPSQLNQRRQTQSSAHSQNNSSTSISFKGHHGNHLSSTGERWKIQEAPCEVWPWNSR